MLMFISETVINLAKIVMSAMFCFSICFHKPVQYTLSNHEESSPYLYSDMLEFAVLQKNNPLHSPYTQVKEDIKLPPNHKGL